MTERRYEDLYPQSRQELLDSLASDDPERVKDALYSAAKYESDWNWTQAQCLRFLDDKDHTIRWAAALSLGFIAVYQRKLDLAEVLPKLHAAKKDRLIAPIVEDSLEMIQKYVKSN
jgi:hypothetical protein